MQFLLFDIHMWPFGDNVNLSDGTERTVGRPIAKFNPLRFLPQKRVGEGFLCAAPK
jgi:hypothetical protein